MGHVLEEMRDQVPYAFLGLNVFLPAVMAKFANYLRTTIQTILFFSLGNM